MSKKLPKRMSVSLRKVDSDRLDKLCDSFSTSKSKIFREALEALYRIDAKGVTLSSLFECMYLLNDRKHIAINKEIMQAIAEELDSDQNKINEKFYEIGSFYWREYKEMRIETLEDLLKHLENHNWFRVIKKDEEKFTLELRVKKLCTLLKSFLEGVFEQSPHEIHMEESRGKILLKTID